MEDFTKKKAGQIIVEHDQKALDLEDDVIEYRKQMEAKTWEDLYDTALKAKDQPLYIGKDFYVVMAPKVERVFKTPQTIMWARRSCPTPVYSQTVFKYRRESGVLEYLWSIPSAILYHHVLRNQTKFLHDKETKQLAQFVVLMESGELLEWVIKENGEKKDAVIRIQNNEENECTIN